MSGFVIGPIGVLPAVVVGGSASFTFGASVAWSTQGTSPYVIPAATFNTGASDIPIVAITQANDFNGGTITGVSVTGPGALTCVQGTNNAGEQAWLCYGSAGALTTANISIAFTGTNIQVAVATGKVTTTTPTPYSTGNSTGTQGGAVASPLSVAATTGSGGIPVNGVAVGVVGDFFASTRSFTSVTPNQDAILNDVAGNGQNLAFGHSTTAGSTNGITVASSGSMFPAWAIVSWSP